MDAPDGDVYAIAFDKFGRTWVANASQGVWVWRDAGQYKNYGIAEGPLGRVTGIAVSPIDSDVWMSTSMGLARYSQKYDKWLYYSVPEGIPGNQISCVTVEKNGDVIAGTATSGLAIGLAKTGFRSWRIVPGPQTMPTHASGDGLPSAQISCLLVARDGTLFCGTNWGLG
jgi:ligand-binding sensor domain-containing protein